MKQHQPEINYSLQVFSFLSQKVHTESLALIREPIFTISLFFLLPRCSDFLFLPGLLLTHTLPLPHLIKILCSSNLSILTTDGCFHFINLRPEFSSYPFTTGKPSVLLITKCCYRDPFLPFIIFFISVLLKFSMFS